MILCSDSCLVTDAKLSIMNLWGKNPYCFGLIFSVFLSSYDDSLFNLFRRQNPNLVDASVFLKSNINCSFSLI